MSEQKESSVLFSLKELMNLEEDRIKQEEDTRAAQAAAAERARLEAERQARDAEEARIRAEEERRRQEDQRSREEAARHEAIRQGEVERARVDAEQRARLEAMQQQQKHEAQLASIKQDVSKKKLRNLLIGGAAVVVVGLSVGGFLVKKNFDEAAQREAAAQANARLAQEEKAKLEAQIKESDAKQATLNQALASAKDEATRLALQKQLEDEQEKSKALKTAGPGRASGGPAKGSSGGDKPACKCTPGDPLCSCL
jgi:colicin import membrane protein